MNILLVEPGYRNKYPPLGLMKISSYHKLIGDNVTFVKGKHRVSNIQTWDRIYISTLFTFHWNIAIETIKFYLKQVKKPFDIYIGGVMATLLSDQILAEKGLENITLIKGLLNKPGVLGNDDHIVDTMIPDYSIIERTSNPLLDYDYKVKDSYIAYTTRGCIRKCKFCAVHKLEPEYCSYYDIKDQIEFIRQNYGEKRHLMLMDNNILASCDLKKIVADLVELGYGRDNKSFTKRTGKSSRPLTRYIDFNQGVDARLLTEEAMKELAKLEIRPLRIAFDDANDQQVEIYTKAVRLAAKYKFKILSNYILFNFNDTPADFYKRLEININLNEEFLQAGLATSIWSFPMKYSPIEGEHCFNRKYIGKNWNAKLLRGIQCVLSATHGVVGPKNNFFKTAFGKNYDDFLAILYMPEEYIIFRKNNEKKGQKWKSLFLSLSEEEKIEFISQVSSNKFTNDKVLENQKMQKLYSQYLKTT